MGIHFPFFLSLVKVELKIQDPCWFHKEENPALVCTVYSLEFAIIWRKNWDFLVHGDTIVDDSLEISLTAGDNNTREQIILFPYDAAVSLVTEETQFICENQGYQSKIFVFGIPGEFHPRLSATNYKLTNIIL